MFRWQICSLLLFNQLLSFPEIVVLFHNVVVGSSTPVHLAVVEMYQMLTVEPGWVKHGDCPMHHSPVVHERPPPLLHPFLKILFLFSPVSVVPFRILN